jgi:hypothetical protein
MVWRYTYCESIRHGMKSELFGVVNIDRLKRVHNGNKPFINQYTKYIAFRYCPNIKFILIGKTHWEIANVEPNWQ